MFALSSALAFGLSLIGPPTLPPERVDEPPTQGDGAGDSAAPPTGTDAPPTSDAPGPERTSLPPGLQPVPFPLEQRRSDGPAPTTTDPGDTEITPMPEPREQSRRSVVDLRDPFDRPPPTPRQRRDLDASRLLMPDLKDPFAPSVRRVRSRRLERHVPNDILDPFRARPRLDGPRPPCVETTEDGTVVQKPGQGKSAKPKTCGRAEPELRDPFMRQRGG